VRTGNVRDEYESDRLRCREAESGPCLDERSTKALDEARKTEVPASVVCLQRSRGRSGLCEHT